MSRLQTVLMLAQWEFHSLLAVSWYSLFTFQMGLRQRKDLSWIHHVVLNKQIIFKSQ